MPLNFTAVDFETANGFRGSPCAVGLTRVRDGRIVDEAFWLMRPPVGYDHFDPRNVDIHGVTEDQVAQQPRFAELFPQIQQFWGDDVVVAHNAAFDTGVIRAGLEVSGAAVPAYQYGCTVILARRSYDLPSYSLPFVADAAGVELVNHHDAIEDARACAGIMIDIAARHGARSVAEVYDTLKLRQPRQEPAEPRPDARPMPPGQTGAAAPATGRAAGDWLPWPEEGVNPMPNLHADRNHPLYGQIVVFTGKLQIPRETAKARAAARGAQPASYVTRSTTVLVVGDGFIAADLRSGTIRSSRLSAKAKRVLDLHRKGQRIEVLSEGEFMQMIG
ncbi:exonuclease domain-containing protein [Psychromicrobium xiongbiense]|uniref:exonuclease domain-containing protein n=1 Tax=Psychromicrobium xiongbiense TaxID=3051184 RepID=UPI00255680A4|nr:exonuclease domain-containing protein [Psychromicrobium sp. YIM S02556]